MPEALSYISYPNTIVGNVGTQEASVLIMPYCDMGDLVFCANYLNHMCEGYTHEHLNVVIGLQASNT